MGRVYRAEHQGLRRRVALKVLDAACSSIIDLGSFIERARAASSVRHPAIVNIFDAGLHEGVAYVVTDLVEGFSLQELIAQRGPLDEATIVDIAVPLASALVALHEAGLVHDDLNPARVFLSEVGAGQIRARMVDATHSKLWRASRSASGVSAIAAPVYMAPEVVLGGAEGPLTDQYRLGLLMYECATGVNPFATEDSRDILRRITTGAAEPLSSRTSLLSKRLIALIERAMHVDPAQRFTSMGELGHELSATAGRRTRITWGLGTRDASAEHGGAALPPQSAPLPSPARRPRRGARLLAWAALALLAGLGLKSVDVLSVFSGRSARHTAAPARQSSALEPRPAPPVSSSPAESAPSAVASEEPSTARHPSNDEPVAASDVAAAAPATLPSRPPPSPVEAITAPARAASATRDETRPAPRRAKPVKPDPQPSVPSAAPDWMITPEHSAPQPSFERGTNEALILD